MEIAQNKLIYSYNLILLGTRPLNLRKKVALAKVAQSEELKQMYRSRKRKAEKPKDTKIQHTVQKIMPGEN